VSNHLCAIPACSCVQTMRTSVSTSARRLHANLGSCAVTAVHAPEKYMQIYIYVYFMYMVNFMHIYEYNGIRTYILCIHIHSTYAHIEYSEYIAISPNTYNYNHARVNVHGIRGIVVRARTLTAFSRAHTCIDDFLSYV